MSTATNGALVQALMTLKKTSGDCLDGTKIESIKSTVNNFAISAAVLGAAADVIPGVGGVLAALTQTGLIWALYVKINKTLGISISENTLKFVGSAIATNIVAGAGYLIAAYAAATVMSFIPVFGQAGSAVTHLALGYILIYASAVVYVNFLTKVFKAQGSFEFDESDKTKQTIKETIDDSNVKDIIKEGKEAFKAAKDSGEFERAKNELKCPSCGAPVTAEQKFCNECGLKLK